MTAKSTVTFRLTVILDEQPDNSYVVTCKELPELLTDGESFEEAIGNVADALVATLEIYQHANRRLPEGIVVKNMHITEPRISTITPEHEPNFWVQVLMPPPQRQLPDVAYAL